MWWESSARGRGHELMRFGGRVALLRWGSGCRALVLWVVQTWKSFANIFFITKRKKPKGKATLCVFGGTGQAGGSSYHHSSACEAAAQIYGAPEPKFMWIICLFRDILLFSFKMSPFYLPACVRYSSFGSCCYINTVGMPNVQTFKLFSSQFSPCSTSLTHALHGSSISNRCKLSTPCWCCSAYLLWSFCVPVISNVLVHIWLKKKIKRPKK